MTTLAAAHLMTHQHAAVAVGADPEINVLTRAVEPYSGDPIERLPMDLGGVESAVERLAKAGWRVTGTWETVEPGYLVADIERD